MAKEYCKKFKKNHPNIIFEEKDDLIKLHNCWSDASCAFNFKFKKTSEISFLDNIIMHDELVAIYHIKEQMYEFIFAPLGSEFNREFNYICEGKEFHLFYSRPSKTFEKLSLNFNLNDSDGITERAFALMRYSKYFQQEKDNKDLYATNFFIKGNFNTMSFAEQIDFFKQINFLMTYYDRKSPSILIFNTSEADPSKINQPCKMQYNEFPKILNSKKFDSTLIDLLEAARTSSSIRLKYIFYYQVIEYASFYYIENEIKRRIENVIRTPDILNSNSYSQIILEIFSDYLKNKPDNQRMSKLLTDFCEYEEIKPEILANAKCFVEDIKFDGGLIIKKLFNKEEDINNAPNGIIEIIRKNIDTIRNVLVHARESRENTVISPTPTNNIRLMPYLYLLRRIAETIVIKYLP